MKIASLLLGCALVTGGLSGAQATDAVVADEYQLLDTGRANACDVYGSGFVAVPGTQTCVRASGQVRFDQRITNSGRASNGRMTLDFESRSD